MKIKLMFLFIAMTFCVSCMNLSGLTVTVHSKDDCNCTVDHNVTKLDYKPLDEMLGQKRNCGGVNVYIGNKSVIVPTDAQATLPVHMLK